MVRVPSPPPSSRLSAVLCFFLVAVFSTRRNECFSLSLGGNRVTNSANIEPSNVPPSRRSFLTLLSTLPVVLPVEACQAIEEEEEATAETSRGGKPFAPLSALLPAARLKNVVDQMYDLSLTLPAAAKSNDKQAQYQVLVQMNQLWINRPPLFLKKNDKVPLRVTTKSSAAQLTAGVSSANKQQYQDLRKDLSIPDRMAAMLNQVDVERQWGMLQYQESKREQGNELRAALNYYTSQLEFGNAYLLTASPQDRKRLIRNEELPSLTAVIASDLDLRDLYRNDFLTALEDVNAEVVYQLKQPAQVEVDEVVQLMGQAHASISKWFDLIAPTDVQQAMEVVKNE